MLDVYAMMGIDKVTPVMRYINMYRGGKLMAPQGFTESR